MNLVDANQEPRPQENWKNTAKQSPIQQLQTYVNLFTPLTGPGFAVGALVAFGFFVAGPKQPNWMSIGISFLLPTTTIWGITFWYYFTPKALVRRLKKIDDLKSKLDKNDAADIKSAYIAQFLVYTGTNIAPTIAELAKSESKAIAKAYLAQVIKEHKEILDRVVQSKIEEAISVSVQKKIRAAAFAHLPKLKAEINEELNKTLDECSRRVRDEISRIRRSE
ncbi:MAG: hypothetical protein ABL888_14700 [Pirellulaceae bacterium]